MKFTPASGAATRMFKGLFEYLSARNQFEGKENEMPPPTDQVVHFLNHLSQFPFYETLKAGLFEKGIFEEEPVEVIKELLQEQGLNYGQLPKGLIKFHAYPEGVRTPIEEHLVEGCLYAADDQGRVHIHFTISVHHRDAFNRLLN